MRLFILFLITIISANAIMSTSDAQSIFSGLIFSEKKEGLMIVGAQSGSPGFDAGLRTGDIVLEIDGKKINNLEDYIKISRESKDKRVEISLVILRKEVQYDVTIKVYSIPIYQYWNEKIAKPLELPQGLTNSPYEYWVDKGNRTLKNPVDKSPFEAKVSNYNIALKFLLNGLHYQPESLDTALRIAHIYHELGNLYVNKGIIKEGVINYRKAIKFYDGCHEKTEKDDYLNLILTSLREIEKSLSNINADELKTPSAP